MGLRFILGRAGTGKTRICLEEIWDWLAPAPVDGPPLILLVPEQASFQMERALTTQGPIRGTTRAQVMSFRRLGWLIFQEAGGTNRRYLDELGRVMTLRSILIQQEANLQIFGSLVRESGFVEKLATNFKELKNYNITWEKLREQYEALDGETPGNLLLKQKLHDLALLYQAYTGGLVDQATDPDDYLHYLAQKIPAAPSLGGARIWVDSFAGFTPLEMKVIGSLMGHCEQVNITLCLDGGDLSQPSEEMDLFHPSRLTYDRLTSLAHNQGVIVEPPRILGGGGLPAPRYRKPALAWLERHYERPRPEFTGELADLSLVKAADRRTEVEGVAREIRRLAREKDYRYRDMAVILRETAGYEELLHTVFGRYQIPFFLDTRRPVTHHPLVELITAALETVQSFWGYEPLFRYLKTDLLPVTRDEVDLLENYVLKYGLRGKAWLGAQPWDLGFDMAKPVDQARQEEIRSVRERAAGALRHFYRQISGTPLSAEAMTSRLYQFLEQIAVPAQLAAWCHQAEAQGQLDEAQAHKRLWDGIMALLDQLVDALGDVIMSPAEYLTVIEAGLQNLQLGLIPPSLDQVLIGAVERSRQPELKAVFLLGLNEGAFPLSIKEDEIFSDEERQALAARRLELAPTSKLQLFHEQYLAYIALTRASEYLWVSYPEADEEGKELQPSPLINHLGEIFPRLQPAYLAAQPGQGDFSPFHYLTDPRQAIVHLAEQLGEGGAASEVAFWQEVYQWLLARPQYRPRLQKILAALFYENSAAPLSSAAVTALYGTRLRGSVSRLETFAACPFKYFLQYGLQLREREIYQVDAPLRGEFYHLALKELVEQMEDRGLSWATITDDQLKHLVHRLTAALIPAMEHGILTSTPLYRHWINLMETNLQTAVAVLTEHARLGSFLPVAVELAFGDGGPLPGVTVALAGGRELLLAGRIDRVDAATLGGRPFLRVIDYKSSGQGLDLVRCYHGLSLQLPVYLNVVLEHYRFLTGEPPAAAGMLYFPVQSPVIRVDNPITAAEAREKQHQKLKMQGRILADAELARAMGAEVGKTRLLDVRLKKDGSFYQDAKVLSARQMNDLRAFTNYKLQELGTRIYQGEAAIAPYRLAGVTPCGFCPYRPCCQFDSLIPGNGYQFLPKLAEEQLWAGVERVLQGGNDRG